VGLAHWLYNVGGTIRAHQTGEYGGCRRRFGNIHLNECDLKGKKYWEKGEGGPSKPRCTDDCSKHAQRKCDQEEKQEL